MPTPRFDKLINELGRAGVHALFPNDFEFYMVMLELVDSEGQTVDFLAFPVAPERITYDNNKLVNIKKSLGGITSLDTESFNPKNIQLAGTFGRKLKLLIGKPPTSTENNYKSTGGGIYGKIQSAALQIKQSTFDVELKTGYGTLKILESIIDKSSGLDTNNEPFRLFLYNPTLNHSFLVKCKKMSFTQDYSSNMLWNYSLDLVAIADVQSLRDQAKEGLDEMGSKSNNKKGDAASNQIKKNKTDLNRQKQLSRNKKKYGTPKFT